MAHKARPFFTLNTQLGNIPTDWLKIIEPKIVRPADSTCWLWQGGTDSAGEPIICYLNLEKNKRSTMRVKVKVMKMFWEGIHGHEILHECGNLNCLNPAHLHVATTGWRLKDRKKLVKKKSTEIRNWARSRKRDL